MARPGVTYLDVYPTQQQLVAAGKILPLKAFGALKGVWERVMNQSEDRIQVIQQETQRLKFENDS